MITTFHFLARKAKLPALIIGLAILPANAVSAQQFLGNARQSCSGNVNIELGESDAPLQVNSFEARSAEVSAPSIRWSCNGAEQEAIKCPDNTNKILIDRSQGGNTFSIICLHQ